MANTVKMDLDGRLKETITFQSEMLHYGLYTSGYRRIFNADIPWHWHDEFELGFVTGGQVVYKTSQCSVILEEGDGIFINSGVLHYLHPIEPFSNARLQTQFFDTTFLAGSPGSLLDIQYIAPVREQRHLDILPFYKKDPNCQDFLENIREGIRLCLERPSFFELRLRSRFSEMWESIYQLARRQEKQPGGADHSLGDERIKKLMLFVQDHYSEKLSVAALAASIPLSERECYRLFQSRLGITPVKYILSVRLKRAQELLMTSGKSVLDIALETGFGTSSYFGKVFYRHHHITPIQYRRLSQQKPTEQM